MNTATSLPRTHDPSAGWVCLRSAPLSRLAALEMLSDQTLQLDTATRQALQALTIQDGTHNTPLRLWAQIDGVQWLARSMQDEERNLVAIKLLILRRANFALLQLLFRLTRQQWTDLRHELGALPPELPRLPRSRRANDALIDTVYDAWHRLLKEYDNDVDRWVVLSEQFKLVPLASLYRLVYEIDRRRCA